MSPFNPFAAAGAVPVDAGASPAPAGAPPAALPPVNLPQMPPAPAWSSAAVPTMSAEDFAQTGAAAPAVPTAFPNGGGVLPDGSRTNDPATWQRWLAGYQPPAEQSPDAAGPGAGTAPAGQAAASAPPTPGSVPQVAIHAPAAAAFNPFEAAGAVPVAPQSVGAAPASAATSPPAASSAPATGAPASGPSAPAASPALLPGQRTGYLANIAAGGNEEIASTLGMPVDLVTGILNLVPRGINAIAGTNIPTIQHPAGGSESIRNAMGIVGANPENVVPGTPGEGLARAAARGAVGVALPGAVAARLAPEVITGASTLTDTVLHGLGQGSGVGATAAGAGGGLVGHAAASGAPEPLKPLADLAGNLAGGGVVAGLQAAGSGAGHIAADMASRMAEPLSIGVKKAIVSPDTGVPFLNERGAPLMSTAGQRQIAGRNLAAAAGMKPAELAASIPSTADRTLVPGSEPTLGQAMGNYGVLSLEKHLRTTNKAPFTAAEAENNAARLRMVENWRDPEAAGAAAADFFAARRAQLEAADNLLVQKERDLAADRASALPGDHAKEEAIGDAQREALEALRKPVKDAASALFDLFDPDGLAALRVSSVADAAKKLLAEVNPRMGGKLGTEGDVIHAAASLPKVVLFSDLRELDSNLAEAQRTFQMQGLANSKGARRVAIVRKAIADAMDNEIHQRVAKDAEEVATGRLSPDDALGAKIAAEVKNWRAARAAGTEPDTGGGRGAADFAEGGPRGVPGVAGEPGAPAAGHEVVGGPGGLEAGTAAAVDLPQAKLVPNFSADDREALRAANQAWRDYKATWGKGTIGQVLMSGSRENGYRMADSAVPAKLFARGKGGAEAADDLIKATGSPEAAQRLLGDFPAFSFRQAAMKDGVVDPAKAAAWLKAHTAALDRFPVLRQQFADAASAATAVDEAAARAQANMKTIMADATRHFLTKAGEPVDPQAAFAKLIASPTGVKDAQQLMEMARTNGAASDGLRSNFVDFLLGKIKSTVPSGTTGEKEISSAAVDRLVKNPRFMGIARAVMGPDDADAFVRMAKDLERLQTSVAGTKIPGSPGTAADLHALAQSGEGSHSMLGQVLIGDAAGRLLGAAANVSGVGGAALRGASIISKIVMDAARHSGLKTVDELMIAAVHHPELARILASEVKLQPGSPALKRLIGQIALLGMSGSASMTLPHKIDELGERTPAR